MLDMISCFDNLLCIRGLHIDQWTGVPIVVTGAVKHAKHALKALNFVVAT